MVRFIRKGRILYGMVSILLILVMRDQTYYTPSMLTVHGSSLSLVSSTSSLYSAVSSLPAFLLKFTALQD